MVSMRNILFITAVLSCGILITGCSTRDPVTVTERDDGIRVFSTTNKIEDTAYIKETTCENENLEAILFEIPFKTSEDAHYKSNIEVIEYLSEDENVDIAQKYIDTAELAALSTYAQDWKTIDEAFYKETIQNLYSASDFIQLEDGTLTVEEYSTRLYELYKNNKISVSGNFTTDKSLIWSNNYIYYVRGVLSLTLNEDKTMAYQKEYGLPLTEESNTLNLIVQVRLMPDNPTKITGIDVLGAL